MAPSEVPQGNPFGRSKVGTRRLATPARIAAPSGREQGGRPGFRNARKATGTFGDRRKGLSMHAGHQWRWADPTLPVQVRGVDSRRVAWPRPERRVSCLQTHSLLRSRPNRSGRSAAPVVRSGMRLLLLAVLALGAYGQKRFPPDIVPQGWLDRRDPLAIDPTHYHLNFENAHVRAIRLTLKANEAVHMHDDVDALAVCIHECHLCFKSFNGRTQDVRMESGETRWFYGDTRSVCNLSARPMEMLFIEVKAASKDR